MPTSKTHIVIIAEQLPWKQGQKFEFIPFKVGLVLIAEHLPGKQGLKHVVSEGQCGETYNIAERLPLKQGLKRIM